MSSEAIWMASYIAALVCALAPLAILYWLALRKCRRLVHKCNQAMRVVDQCAGIIKPLAKQSREFTGLVGVTITRHERKHDEELQAAARAIDVVRGDTP